MIFCVFILLYNIVVYCLPLAYQQSFLRNADFAFSRWKPYYIIFIALPLPSCSNIAQETSPECAYARKVNRFFTQVTETIHGPTDEFMKLLPTIILISSESRKR